METVISDVSGRPLGKLVENGDEIRVCTIGGIPLAKFNKRSGYTSDMAGRPLARGNILASFLKSKYNDPEPLGPTGRR